MAFEGANRLLLNPALLLGGHKPQLLSPTKIVVSPLGAQTPTTQSGLIARRAPPPHCAKLFHFHQLRCVLKERQLPEPH